MPHFIINGGKKLKGEISVNGAKNVALKIIPAIILSGEPCVITNLPLIEDVTNALNLIEYLGAKVNRKGNKVAIDPGKINKLELPLNIASKFRTLMIFLAIRPLGRPGKDL